MKNITTLLFKVIKYQLLLRILFNTAGPVNMDMHYKIDPLTRWDLNEILIAIVARLLMIKKSLRLPSALNDCFFVVIDV